MQETRETAYEKLRGLRTKYGERASKLGDANEAATRLLLVDEILSLLGWTKDEFNPESRSSPKSYIDYRLAPTGAPPRLIVEAKRVSYTFGPPRSILRKTEYNLSYINTAFGSALNDVIEQARRYCEETGIPYAVVTNGAEWLAAQLIAPPGKSVSDLKCLYFGNLLAEGASFDVAWETLSRQSIVAGGLEETFDALNRLEYEFYREPRAELGEWWGFNPHSAPPQHIREFYHRFFDEMIDPRRRTMLEHCFVTSSRLDQYESALKRALSDAAPKYVPDAEELEPGDTRKLLSISTGDRQGRVVLVVGSVGAGKTTFITRIFLSKPSDDYFFMKVDLINEIEVSPTHVWQHLASQIKQRAPSYLEYDGFVNSFIVTSRYYGEDQWPKSSRMTLGGINSRRAFSCKKQPTIQKDTPRQFFGT